MTQPLRRAVLTVSKYEPHIVKLESDLDPTVEDSPFGVCINLTKRWHLMWWKNYLSQTPLPNVGDVFGVDEETVLSERLFAEDSQHPKWFRSETVGQKLATRVVRFETCLETRLFFKKQSRVDPTLRR